MSRDNDCLIPMVNYFDVLFLQYVAHKLNLCLKSCSVSLVNYGKEVLKVSVTNMITSFENRPDSDGFG